MTQSASRQNRERERERERDLFTSAFWNAVYISTTHSWSSCYIPCSRWALTLTTNLQSQYVISVAAVMSVCICSRGWENDICWYFWLDGEGRDLRQEYINIILKVPSSLYKLNLIKIQEPHKMLRKSLSTKGSNSSIERLQPSNCPAPGVAGGAGGS